jgi:energy-coupling factor transport system permease protein
VKYQPGQSLLHRLHPVVKLAWVLWLTVAVFVFGSPELAGLVVGVAVALLWIAGLAPWRIGGIRLWFTLGLVIFATQAAFVRSGTAVIGPITSDGLHAGALATGRLWAIVMMSSLFVTTTDPVNLACALMSVGLPYRWGFALVTALRLAPLFRLEAHHVYRAQLARGMAYDARGPRRWWLVLRRLCFPLLVSALRTAHSLSLSMEGRAFGLHRRRTYTREVKATWRDLAAGALLVVSIGLAIYQGSTAAGV